MMRYEVIEAIMEHFNNDEDTMVECLVYLSNLSEKDVKSLSYGAQDALEGMDRCCDCGSKLYAYTWEERHTELDGNPIEYLTELRCPNCKY